MALLFRFALVARDKQEENPIKLEICVCFKESLMIIVDDDDDWKWNIVMIFCFRSLETRWMQNHLLKWPHTYPVRWDDKLEMSPFHANFDQREPFFNTFHHFLLWKSQISSHHSMLPWHTYTHKNLEIKFKSYPPLNRAIILMIIEGIFLLLYTQKFKLLHGSWKTWPSNDNRLLYPSVNTIARIGTA